jgi:hypothetical protein
MSQLFSGFGLSLAPSRVRTELRCKAARLILLSGFAAGMAGVLPALAIPSCPSNAPQMGGQAASTLITVAPGGVLSYAIKQTDQDTDSQCNLFTDPNCGVTPSFQSTKDAIVTLQGVDTTTGTYTWAINGTAIKTPGLWMDSFLLYNSSADLAVYRDPSLTITQVVRIAS